MLTEAATGGAVMVGDDVGEVVGEPVALGVVVAVGSVVPGSGDGLVAAGVVAAVVVAEGVVVADGDREGRPEDEADELGR
jgi:hypothetical protein